MAEILGIRKQVHNPIEMADGFEAPADIMLERNHTAEAGSSCFATNRLRQAGALLLATVVTAAGGEAIKTDTAEASLRPVGPALSSNLKKANAELDWVLEKTGPNGVLARSIAKRLNIKTAKGRRKYITPENVDLGKKVKASNSKFPYNTGSTGSNPVSVPNKHPNSDAFTVVLNKANSKSESTTKVIEEDKVVLKYSVLRKLCENLLDKKPRKHSKQRVNNKVRMDVSFGFKKDVEAVAKSMSESTSKTEVTCPDGTRVIANADAKADALAKAAASLRTKGEMFIKGTSLTVAKAKLKYSSELKAFVSAKTSTETSTSVECAPALLPLPPSPVNLPPSVDLIGPQHVLVGGEMIQICEFESDPENDIRSRSFSETGNGNFVSQVYAGNEAGEYCIDYKAGTTADEATVTATVRDSVNEPVSDTEKFPIVADRGQF